MRARRHWVVKGAAFLVLAIALAAVLSFVVMSLWNTLVPSLFGGGRGHGARHGHWRQRMWRERWESMTPEERARVREKLQHCGWGPVEETAEQPKP